MKIGDETKKHRQKHQQGPEPDKPNHQLSSRAVNITDCRDRLGDCMAGVVRTGHQSNTQGPLRQYNESSLVFLVHVSKGSS